MNQFPIIRNYRVLLGLWESPVTDARQTTSVKGFTTLVNHMNCILDVHVWLLTAACVIFSVGTPAVCITLVFSKRAGHGPCREGPCPIVPLKDNIAPNITIFSYVTLVAVLHKVESVKWWAHPYTDQCCYMKVTHLWLHCSCYICSAQCSLRWIKWLSELLSSHDFTILWLSWGLAQCLDCCNIFT